MEEGRCWLYPAKKSLVFDLEQGVMELIHFFPTQFYACIWEEIIKVTKSKL